MKNLTLTFICIICIWRAPLAQNGNYTMGARSASLGGASTTIGDEWALFNNIGGLSYHTQTTAFVSYRNLYGLPEFSSISFGATHPLWNGVSGLGFFRFGNDLYNEQRANLGFSNQFGIVSLGINLSYYQLNIEGAGTSKNFIIDFGGQARLIDQLYFGAHVSNMNQATLSSTTDEKIPTIMKTGLSYRPNQNMMVNVELEKELEKEARLKLGLEHKMLEQFSIRTGFSTQPFEASFGLGFTPGKIGVDYYYGNNPDLGDIHQFSISYHFTK